MLRKNSQTSEENVFIRVVTCQVPGLELATLSEKSVRYKYFAVKFVKILKIALCRTTWNGCFWTSRGVLRN